MSQVAKLNALSNDGFFHINTILLDKGAGILPYLQRNFIELYRKMLDKEWNASNASSAPSGIVQQGITTGIQRFQCIIAKYAFEDNENRIVERKNALRGRCVTYNEGERAKGTGRGKYGKPFKYDEIQRFSPYDTTLQAWEQIDIGRHMDGKNAVAAGVQRYINALAQITETRAKLAQADVARLCPAGQRMSVLMDKAKITADMFPDRDIYDQVLMIMGCMEAYVSRQFVKFADVMDQLRIECEIATYALIDERFATTGDLKEKQASVRDMAEISRFAAGFYASVKRVADCWAAYFKDPTMSMSRVVACVEKGMQPYMGEHINGTDMLGGGFFGNMWTYTKNAAKAVVEAVIIKPVHAVAMITTGLLTVVTFVLALVGCLVLQIIAIVVEAREAAGAFHVCFEDIGRNVMIPLSEVTRSLKDSFTDLYFDYDTVYGGGIKDNITNKWLVLNMILQLENNKEAVIMFLSNEKMTFEDVMKNKHTDLSRMTLDQKQIMSLLGQLEEMVRNSNYTGKEPLLQSIYATKNTISSMSMSLSGGSIRYSKRTLSTLPKKTLMSIAADWAVPRRSQMTKEELVKVLSKWASVATKSASHRV